MENYKKILEEKGYLIIPNILNKEELNYALQLHKKWQKSIKGYNDIVKLCNNGIHKFLEAGQQEFAWYLRTRPQILGVFKYLWNCEDLITSFDGSCHILKECEAIDNYWVHTDQGSEKEGLHCYQSLVSLTDNCQRTLVVYEGSHKLHKQYFQEMNLKTLGDWHIIDRDYVNNIAYTKKILTIPAGSLVIWDSRTFHHNQYGEAKSEERIVQYLCYFPSNHHLNTEENKKLRRKYFDTRRTTTHWPAPILPVATQPYLYGQNYQINYDALTSPDLENMMEDITKLL